MEYWNIGIMEWPYKPFKTLVSREHGARSKEQETSKQSTCKDGKHVQTVEDVEIVQVVQSVRLALLGRDSFEAQIKRAG